MKQIQQKIKKIQKNQQKNIERFSTISQNEVESSSIASSTVSFILFGLAMYYTYSITWFKNILLANSHKNVKQKLIAFILKIIEVYYNIKLNIL